MCANIYIFNEFSNSIIIICEIIRIFLINFVDITSARYILPPKSR